jgi:hypothetical protein
MSHNIDTLYFGYQPAAGHMEECPRYGSDVWEVTQHADRKFSGDVREVTLRLACFECGVVRFDRSGPDTDLAHETTLAAEVGYASKPDKVVGVWLWPGPRIWHGDERGPLAYLITLTGERPRQAGDVIGKVGWYLGKRGGTRWSAGAGCTPHGTVLASEHDFASRRAAVAWVIANRGDAR